MKYYLRTYGCQMNVHDSEKISGIFHAFGYERAESASDADVIVINTCSIREKAEQKFFSDLGRLRTAKKRNPDMKIAVAGCIAQQRGNNLFKRFPQVDFLFGPNNIDSLQSWLRPANASRGKALPLGMKTIAVSDNPTYHLKSLPLKRVGQVRAWVSIMHGCDNFCSYCVVPYTRGRERSRPVSDITDEIRNIAGLGYREITLLGQNVNSYGKNLSGRNDFPGLLKVIHEIQGILRIRFVTSHPKDLSDELVECMRDLPKVCEHIHLPIQSGSDRILALMNRNYTYEQFREKVKMLRDAVPGISITSDIIAGFPGETEEDFQHTLTALKEIQFDGIFSFKYSKRPNTTALSLPDHVDDKTGYERLEKILKMQEDITFSKNKELEGMTVEVLVEGESESHRDKLTGRTRTNKIVNFHGHGERCGSLINVKVLEAWQHSLYGERVL